MSTASPLTVKLAYGQMALAVVAFAFVPFSVLKSANSDPTRVVAAVVVDETASESSPAAAVLDSGDPVARGEALFGQSCAGCHQPTGLGIPGVFPPLASSDFLLADKDRAVRVVLNGLVGPVTVNGVTYESAMPPMPFSDEEIAAVLSYVNQAWGNQGSPVSAADVARIRAEPAPGS